jgi:hypothetical protein
MEMSKNDIMSLLFTLIFAGLVIGFVFISFSLLSKYERNEVASGVDDADILADAEKERGRKSPKALRWVGKALSWLFELACVAFIGFCVYVKASGSDFWFFGRRALTIESGSMSSLNASNPMKEKITDAMKAQEFTMSDLVFVSEFDGKSSDPVADGTMIYTYRSPKDGTTVIHRLWDVGTVVQTDGTTDKVCLFVGDANPIPDDYEATAKKEITDRNYSLEATWSDGTKAVGHYVYQSDLTSVYAGKAEGLGNFIRFAQAPVGVETAICIVVIVIGCSFFIDKVGKYRKDRGDGLAAGTITEGQDLREKPDEGSDPDGAESDEGAEPAASAEAEKKNDSPKEGGAPEETKPSAEAAPEEKAKPSEGEGDPKPEKADGKETGKNGDDPDSEFMDYLK